MHWFLPEPKHDLKAAWCPVRTKRDPNRRDWTSPGRVDTSSLLFEHRGGPMSSQRYTPEFKDEVVRQIVERGYSVTEVS